MEALWIQVLKESVPIAAGVVPLYFLLAKRRSQAWDERVNERVRVGVEPLAKWQPQVDQQLKSLEADVSSIQDLLMRHGVGHES